MLALGNRAGHPGCANAEALTEFSAELGRKGRDAAANPNVVITGGIFTCNGCIPDQLGPLCTGAFTQEPARIQDNEHRPITTIPYFRRIIRVPTS